MATSGAVTHTLQADFSGTAFGGSPTWTDITAYLMSSANDPGGQPVAMPWGRQDQSSTVEPASTVLVLKNSDGRFTPGNTSSPYYPHVKRHVRMRYTITSGTTLTLFDGYVDSWTVTVQTDGPTLCTVSLSDTFARLSATTELQSLYVEQVLPDAPQALYTFQEDSSSTSAGNQAAVTQSALTTITSKYGAGNIIFGVAGAVASSGTAVSLNTTLTTGSVNDHVGSALSGPPIAGVIPTADYTIEVWASTRNVLASLLFNSIVVLAAAGKSFGIGINGDYYCGVAYRAGGGGSVTNYYGPISFSVSASGTGWHHLVLTYVASTDIYTLYIDGAAAAGSLDSSAPAWTPATLYVGYDPVYDTYFRGSLQDLAIYNTALSATQVSTHYQIGLQALAGESTSARFLRLLSLRPNLGGTTTGTLGTIGAGDITGMTLGDALTDVATAEGGVIQTNRGTLTLIGRSNWSDPATTLTLNAATGQVDLPTTWRDDTQGLLNDVTVSRPNGASQRIVNAASVAADGVAQTSITANVNSDRDAADMAGWLVAVGVQEHVDCPTLTVNLYVRNSASLTMAVCALKTFDIVTLTNLPASAPASTMSFQVQGGTLTVGADTFTAELYTTVMPPTTLRADATADTYTKLDTGNVIGW